MENITQILVRIIVIRRVIEEMVRRYNFTYEKARREMYETDLIKMIDDKDTGLMAQSPFYIIDIYDRLIKYKK